ncbi:MAG: nuclease-related domain-containing protein [Lacisediminihabitans sp.]
MIAELLRVKAGETPRSAFARLFGADPLSGESQPWFLGAVGEITVGGLLSHLGPGWTVLHAVPIGSGSSDIDHVLVGPAGVFTVNTKNHSGQNVWVAGRTVMAAGTKYPYIRNSEHEVGRAERLLTSALGETVVVTGLLVIVDPKALVVREMPRDVEVITSRGLLRWLTHRKPVLTPDEVQRIASVAEQLDTWRQGLEPVEDSASVWHDFEELRRQINRARMRRQLWVGIFTILIVVTATALTSLAFVDTVRNWIGR